MDDITRNALPLYLSVKEVPKLGISTSAFYRLVHMDEVPSLQVGDRHYLDRDGFFAWADEQTQMTKDPWYYEA